MATTDAYDTCLAVRVEVEKDIMDTDKLSIALAFVLGAIVGALVLLLCAKLCLKDFAKKKVSRRLVFLFVL